MPPVAIKYIVSFSSQDDKHPVSNLVKGDGFKKWLSHPQEKSGQIEAVFQLEQPCIISYVDIGSIWCATLEIKVGRSDWPAGRDFETLAYTVNLMTPAECITSKNPNKTQMFSHDLFCPEIAKKEWDRIKVICRQPYKKMVQFGLSFLRVKTSVATISLPAREIKENTTVSSSVKDIQKHFLERLDNGPNKRNDQLKSRLLKIAASSENGIEHDDSLSRTAKLVLAASGNKPKSYTANSPVPNAEKLCMYSSRVEQKYGPQFDEEVDDFLKQMVIDPSELDSITMADVRHKFERKKRRKLTKDEKKTFIKKATTHLTSAFKDKTNHSVEKENLSTEKQVLLSFSEDSCKRTNNSVLENVVGPVEKLVPVNDKSKKPSIKRKLENDIITPPRKKVIKEDSSPLTVMQKLKSSENQSASERKVLIGQLKKAKQAGPMTDCVTSPGTPFHYKGLRGRESDFDSQLTDPVSPSVTACTSQSISSDKCGFSSLGPAKESSSFLDNFTPIKVDSFETVSSSDDDTLYVETKATNGHKVGVRSRGGKRGGRKGRGRGRGKQTSTPVSDCLDLSVNTSTLTTRCRGRGRGRGKRRGTARNKPEQTTANQGEATVDQEEIPAPRGFTKCSGCGDYFGDALLSAHEQRCAAHKARQGSRERIKSSDQVPSENRTSAVSPPRRQGKSTASLEMRPTSFVKCDGCNEYFGPTLLNIHQQKCVRWKNLDTSKSPVPSSESPWLSAKTSGRTIGQPDSDASSSSSGHRLGTDLNSSAYEGQRSNVEQMRSPPWLLAAERRLQQQQNSNMCNNTLASLPCGNGEGTRNRSLDSNNSLSSLPSPVIESQQWMLEKYERQRNTVDTQEDLSQSLLQTNAQTSNYARNSLGYKSSTGGLNRQVEHGATGTHRRNSITKNRFSAVELSDDSDDDDADHSNVNYANRNASGNSGANNGVDLFQVECPLCGDFYPFDVIEMHASNCYL